MTLTRRTFLAGTTGSLIATGLWAQTGDIIKIAGPAFGAHWRVSLPMGIDTDAVVAEVSEIIGAVDMMMSPFHPSSEISVFNRTRTIATFPVSADVITTVLEARRIAELTQGAFDPTLGGVVGRYGFGPITSAPAGAFADLVIARTGLRKAHAAQTLDLCGIAKGFALDRIAAALRQLGHQDFFVELGGEVFAQGQHPQGRRWQAGLERPAAGDWTLQGTVTVAHEALATSGDLVNSYLYDDRRYCHIIDPQSQQPTQSALASVSVFAPRAMAADALATALYAMGPHDGVDFARRHRIPALFITRSPSGLIETMTHDFSDRRMG